MVSEPRFGRVITAMVTPFSGDGTINFDVARDVARFLVNNGSDGIVVAGSTGEGGSLSDNEKLDLFACIAEAVSVPVLAGSTSEDTARSISLTAAASATGIQGILATTPAYSRPSQSGIAAHIGAVAEATKLPVMVYDIPSRTGRSLVPTGFGRAVKRVIRQRSGANFEARGSLYLLWRLSSFSDSCAIIS
ncbi:MAG: hypothetical protein EBR99_08245 [Actinobacteria bacterium]|nr:hypothetical protein [Actinomycetota bacterium]